ncbi:MAG TPA: chromosome segregation protein SMC [Methanoregulaceae archaeon]|nr:MAG: chromosome segregation protein SMC [Methanolinea sp.]HON81203.1 chromosome segregation protein SMC [Methanoregulaceae archaeon]HPD09853.1 chromosome segregation protein SMC [Methanoregulaceae archaeon]HRT14956.1 chromosome segregation protein SMC [Methanoregulaceae archaeon]HRU30429.1 chromosome segregation protein SMC [Methanoregulaceae archaeon]
MHITELEIDNFKSFIKKAKIPFFEGFTVISGPNGSGKSNIIDSILFVLALSSSRTLRAEKLTDLINLNSGKQTAEVSLSFSDGTRIRRRIKRTASGYYSYTYLNEKPCKQADITDFLSRHGIIPHGYNVVMQGDVTRIIEMSDFERRKIIDEIAGVAEFDAKKEQAIRELEVVRERIEREEMLLSELSQRLGELAEERKQALKYREWQEKLRKLETCRAGAFLNAKEKDLASLVRVIADQELALSRVASDRSLEENEWSYLKADLDDIARQINQKSGTEYLKLIADLEEAKGVIRLSEQAIGRARKEKEANLEGMNRSFVDQKRAEERITECTNAIREMTIDRTNLAMETAAARGQIEKLGAEIQDQSRDVEGARDKLFSLMQAIEAEKANRSGILHQKDLILEKSRMRTLERERLEERLREIEGDLASRVVQRKREEQQESSLREEKKAIEQEISALEASVFAKRSSAERLREELRGIEHETMRLEAQQQAQGEPGSRALEAVLAMAGVHGTIARLGKAPPEYTTALNVAAGGKLHYVVVDDDKVAAAAIRYLKDQKLGRLTFLPLAKLRPAPLPELPDNGIIGHAVRMLEYEPQFEPAFRVVFGATVVVESLDRGRQLLGKYRMVTRDGELLERSGAMTGGSFKKPPRGFGAAVEDEIDRLRQRAGEIRSEIADLENAVKQGSAGIEERRGRRSAIDGELQRFTITAEEIGRQSDLFSQEKERVEGVLAVFAEEVRSGTADLAALEASLDTSTGEIAQLTRRMEQLKKRLDDTTIPALTESLEKKRRELDDAERRLRNKESDIADLSRERQHFVARVEELKGEKTRLAEVNRQIDADIASAEAQIEESREAIQKVEERQKEFSGELDGLRTRHSDTANAIHESEKKLLEFDSAKERIAIQLDALHGRQASLAAEIESLRGEVGEVTTDLSLSEIEDGIAEASTAMRKIGAVNMLAIEEYDRVESRVNERQEKKEILSRERTTLLSRIERFETMKFEAFMTAYRAIDANFRGIFARLTSGSGRLILENEEDPFKGGLSFAVQPRDKAVHLLSALSGGEKSLTTLAFIFSIQQHLPAPFYAFDEVDMSLDGSNVERIGEMIRDLSGTSQFIIVSLRKPMIEGADRILGVTLLPDKSSFVTGVRADV